MPILPLPVILILLGVALGFLIDGTDVWGRSAFTLEEINAPLIASVIVPTLIFQAAYNIQWHRFRSNFSHIITLGLFGGLVSASLMACIARGAFSYSWTWATCFLFGFLLISTDVSHVSNCLQHSKKGQNLAAVLEGEFLLSIGLGVTAFLLIQSYLDINGNVNGNPVILIPRFLLVCFLGSLWGLGTAWFTSMIISHIHNDEMVEVCVTLSMNFLTYLIAEQYFGISGKMAAVVFGLYVSRFTELSHSKAARRFLVRFWDMSKFLLTALVLVMVGCVLAHDARLGSQQDWAALFITYGSVHAIRLGMIALAAPVLKFTGYGLEWGDVFIHVWGANIHGAITLVLALLVASDRYIHRQTPRVANEFIFLGAGMVFLTVLINGSTLNWLVRRLKQSRYGNFETTNPYLSEAIIKLNKENVDSLHALRLDHFFSDVHWATARALVQLHQKEGRLKTGKKEVPYNDFLDEPSSQAGDDASSSYYSKSRSAHDEVSEESVKLFLVAEKSSYLRQHDEGSLSDRALRKLLDSCDSCLETPWNGQLNMNQRRIDWLFSSLKISSMLFRLQHVPLLGWFIRRVMYWRMLDGFEVARAFITAQEEASRNVDKDINPWEIGALRDEVETGRNAALALLVSYEKDASHVARLVTTRHAALYVLSHARLHTRRLRQAGEADEAATKTMLHLIESRIKQTVLPCFDQVNQTIDKSELLRDVPWIAPLNKQTFLEIQAASQNVTYNAGDIVIPEGSRTMGVLVIAAGTVKVVDQNGLVLTLMGRGSVIGEISCLTGIPVSASIVADSPLSAFYIRDTDLFPLMMSSPILERHVWRMAGLRLAEHLLQDNMEDSRGNQMTQSEFREFLMKWKLITPYAGQTMQLHPPAILIYGDATITENIGVGADPHSITLPLSVPKRVRGPAILREQKALFENEGAKIVMYLPESHKERYGAGEITEEGFQSIWKSSPIF
eukprot:GILJ01001913.1.p1 GENE.GILJ01001913.1~~GILJ01001913.1.p1  ORF type:complete len:1050 (+),score=115.39 GILJ01001913.1:277-3150(+)